MTHICVGNLTIIGSDGWTAPSHYLYQCWNFVNWTFRNKLQWNLIRNWNIFIQENALQSVVWKMSAILSRTRCVNMTMFDNMTPNVYSQQVEHIRSIFITSVLPFVRLFSLGRWITHEISLQIFLKLCGTLHYKNSNELDRGHRSLLDMPIRP